LTILVIDAGQDLSVSSIAAEAHAFATEKEPEPQKDDLGIGVENGFAIVAEEECRELNA
jgi:hypothetical protein